MKYIAVFMLGLASFTTISAQKSVAKEILSNEYEAECGKPLAEGKVYDYREGKVARIADGTTLVFEQQDLNGDEKKATYFIQLAGIDWKGEQAAIAKFLTDKIVGREVMIAGNTKNDSDTGFSGSIWVAGVGDVNRYLLKIGLAGFSEPEYKSVSPYIMCVYRQTANKAKSERIGIWANQ